jgi:hypothetical protein
MAMRWVGENAAAFGGDPRKVTLFGVGGRDFRQWVGVVTAGERLV